MGGRVSKGLPASVINDFDWCFRAILGSTMDMFKGLRSTKFIHNFVASTISDAFFSITRLMSVTCLALVFSNNSFQDISTLFQHMFSDSEIAEEFIIGWTEVIYINNFE